MHEGHHVSKHYRLSECWNGQVGTEGVAWGKQSMGSRRITDDACSESLPALWQERAMLGQDRNWPLTPSAHVPKFPRVSFSVSLGYVQISFGRT